MQQQYQTKSTLPAIDSAALIKDDVQNKGRYRIGRIQEHIKGKNEVIRGFKLKLGYGNVMMFIVIFFCFPSACSPFMNDFVVLVYVDL